MGIISHVFAKQTQSLTYLSGKLARKDCWYNQGFYIIFRTEHLGKFVQNNWHTLNYLKKNPHCVEAKTVQYGPLCGTDGYFPYIQLLYPPPFFV